MLSHPPRTFRNAPLHTGTPPKPDTKRLFTARELWPGACVMLSAMHLRLRRSRVQLPVVPLSAKYLGQVVHTHVPLSPSSMIRTGGRGAVMHCGWEGNRRFGVALGHASQTSVVYPPTGSRPKESRSPALLSTLYLTRTELI